MSKDIKQPWFPLSPILVMKKEEVCGEFYWLIYQRFLWNECFLEKWPSEAACSARLKILLYIDRKKSKNWGSDREVVWGAAIEYDPDESPSQNKDFLMAKPGELKDAPLIFCPSQGTQIVTWIGPPRRYNAARFRELYPDVIWEFNPWTGATRPARQRKLDPYGHTLEPPLDQIWPTSFHPTSGARCAFPGKAEVWRMPPFTRWTFNPWTGVRRDEGEVEADPLGFQIDHYGYNLKPPLEDGWIKWNGGKRPVDADTLVHVIRSNNLYVPYQHLQQPPTYAGCYRWDHPYGEPQTGDIIEYRVYDAEAAEWIHWGLQKGEPPVSPSTRVEVELITKPNLKYVREARMFDWGEVVCYRVSSPKRAQEDTTKHMVYSPQAWEARFGDGRP